MDRGYQILEPAQLNPLCAKSKYFDFAVVVFYWLIEQLRMELKDQLTDVRIEVIKVEYLGAYPCLGIHYDHPGDTPDVAPLIETTIDRLLQNRTALEIVAFISANGSDWTAIKTKLMSEEDRSQF